MSSGVDVSSPQFGDPDSQPGRGKTAMVAALQREVGQLVKGWKTVNKNYQGRDFLFFEHNGTVLVCGGIGAEPARRATEAVVNFYQPERVISVGFAGALTPELKVGDCLIPRSVIDARDSSRIDTEAGRGVLVTYGDVADSCGKARLAESYGAEAVDMEAAAVARGAEAHGIPFSAIKVISDRLNFVMPPVQRFVDLSGQFQTARFALHCALRPWLWKSVLQLGRNSSIACGVLRNTLANESIFVETASKRGKF